MLCSVIQVDEKIFGSLEFVVKTKYAGADALDPESLLLNVIMFQVCASATQDYE